MPDPRNHSFRASLKISFCSGAVSPKAKPLILDVLKSGQFSPGPMVREFEKKFAGLHQAKHAIFVNSGTDALRLSLLALKEKYHWPDGSFVAVPALTFPATINIVIQSQLKPFFVDVGMHDYCMNSDNLDWRLTTGQVKIVAAVPVHLFGQACDPRIFTLATKWKFRALEDSCETILNPLQGDISCHSTYMAHHVTTGVGGFALTNDDELNLLIRSYANHGRNVKYLPGYNDTSDLSKRFQFDRVGYSSRGTEFEAALGLSQLHHLKDNLFKRRAIADSLIDFLQPFKELIMPVSVHGRRHSWMMFPIVLRPGSGIKKYKLCEHLEQNGIETRDMMPITNQPCYKGLVREEDFGVAQMINRNGFYIPCHEGITSQDVRKIRDAFTTHLTINRK